MDASIISHSTIAPLKRRKNPFVSQPSTFTSRQSRPHSGSGGARPLTSLRSCSPGTLVETASCRIPLNAAKRVRSPVPPDLGKRAFQRIRDQ